ncbi:hypothetical protein K435DRAFT_576280, partial [Dendrothele bispora CBS 962.96]
MGRHAESETLKARRRTEIMDKLYRDAVQLYRTEHTPGTTLPNGREKALSLRAVCEEITTRYWEETGKHPPEPLNKSRLERHVKGGVSKSQSNADRGWLTHAEAEEIVNYCLEMADRGFPLTHQDLQTEVNSILRARLGAAFLGVGKRW